MPKSCSAHSSCWLQGPPGATECGRSVGTRASPPEFSLSGAPRTCCSHGELEPCSHFLPSRSFSPQYIFVDAFVPYLWITTDFCKSIQGFSIPFRAADLLLHSRNPNLVLGFDRSHPNKQVSTAAKARGPSFYPNHSLMGRRGTYIKNGLYSA